MFLFVNLGQAGPSERVQGLRHQRLLERVAQAGVLVLAKRLQEREVAKHQLVAAQFVDRAFLHRRRHRAHQNTVFVRHRRNDPSREVVLQVEDASALQGPVVVLGPQVSAKGGVGQINAEPQRRSGAAQRPLEDVARIDLRSVDPRDHAQIGKSRQARRDVVGQTVRERFGVGASRLRKKRQNRNSKVTPRRLSTS